MSKMLVSTVLIFVLAVGLLPIRSEDSVQISELPEETEDDEPVANNGTAEGAAEVRVTNSVIPTDIRFLLYTRFNPRFPDRLIPGDLASIRRSHLVVRAPVKFIFHGFGATVDDASWLCALKDAYIKMGLSYNIILVDWSLLVHMKDLAAISNTYVVAKYSAALLDTIVGAGLTSCATTHLLGHGIGAHAAALTANLVRTGTIPRITALDPVKIIFSSLGSDFQLDAKDAPMVDVIHTDAIGMGYKGPKGTVDFYPHGGDHPQPGCLLHACSHMRSTELYIESVLNPAAFRSCKCANYHDYKSRRCGCEVVTHMGEYCASNATGLYFLKTYNASPYSKP